METRFGHLIPKNLTPFYLPYRHWPRNAGTQTYSHTDTQTDTHTHSHTNTHTPHTYKYANAHTYTHDAPNLLQYYTFFSFTISFRSHTFFRIGPAEEEPSYVRHDSCSDDEIMENYKLRIPPKFCKPLKNLQLVEGNKAYLECTVSPQNDPTMVIEWFKDDTPILQVWRFWNASL